MDFFDKKLINFYQNILKKVQILSLEI